MGLLDALQGLGSGTTLFPTDPSQNVDPALAQKNQSMAMLQLGLGMLGAAHTRNPYAGAAAALGSASTDYQGAMQNAFKNTLVKRQQDRQDAADANAADDRARQQRTDAAVTASRLVAGLSNATDKNAYWNLVSKSPDVQSLTKLGITLPMDPGQSTGVVAQPDFGALTQQLQGLSSISGTPAAPVKLSPGEQMFTATGQPIAGFGLPDSKIGKPSPESFTPASLQKYQGSGNLSDLVPVDKSDAKPILTDVTIKNPDGTMGTQKQWVYPNTTGGVGVGAVAPQEQGMGSGRIQTMIGRITLAGNEVTQSAENLMKLGTNTDSGWFGITNPQHGGVITTMKNALANSVSKEDTKSYGIMVSGVKRNLAAIEAAGNMPPGSLTSQMDQVELKPGDTQLNKLQRMAEIRQISTAGLDSILTQPGMTDQQKAQVQAINDRMQKAIPFTQADILNLQQSQSPHATIGDMATSAGVTSPSPGWTVKKLP